MVVMASILITYFMSWWRPCTVPDWVKSGTCALLVRHVCFGYAGTGPTEFKSAIPYRKKPLSHHGQRSGAL